MSAIKDTPRHRVKGLKKMPLSDARKRANAKYNAKAYEQLITRVPKGKKADLQTHASDMSESLNAFVNRAIDNQVERDKGGDSANA